VVRGARTAQGLTLVELGGPTGYRDASFTAAFDAVIQAAGARVVRCAFQAPVRNEQPGAPEPPCDVP